MWHANWKKSPFNRSFDLDCSKMGASTIFASISNGKSHKYNVIKKCHKSKPRNKTISIKPITNWLAPKSIIRQIGLQFMSIRLIGSLDRIYQFQNVQFWIASESGCYRWFRAHRYHRDQGNLRVSPAQNFFQFHAVFVGTPQIGAPPTENPESTPATQIMIVRADFKCLKTKTFFFYYINPIFTLSWSTRHILFLCRWPS